MTVLSNVLAEKIVERTMQAVNRNINIMNESGIIIASGDKDRIGSIHEGAIIAIKRKEEFIIDEKQSKKLQGVSEGINLIIEYGDEIVGVIGITGKYKEVAGYGKLIKMTAEMMIEQEAVIKEIEWNNRIKEELMLSLIYNKQGSSKIMQEYIKKFNISQDHPMMIFIIDVSLADNFEKLDLNVLNRIVNLVEGVLPESLVAVINSRSIIALYKCPRNLNNTSHYGYQADRISEGIYAKSGIKTRIAVGKSYDKISDIHKSFEIALETFEFGKKMHPQDSTYIFDLLKYEMLFTQTDKTWKVNELQDTYNVMQENDKKGELMETLKVFIEENGELNNVAEKLFIHRNTLSYRLNKICALTNKNPKKYNDLFWLYSAIINFQNR